MVEYSAVLLFVCFSIFLSCLLPALSYILGVKNGDSEKLSVYECGFDPFGDSRQKFEVRFFLVAILFIIFDLEISFLLASGNDSKNIVGLAKFNISVIPKKALSS